MKYLQSFYQYPVTFSSIEKTVPARNASGETRNICELTEAQVDTLHRCEPLYRELIRAKKYRLLNKLPESYKSSAAQINEARTEADRLRAENERLQAMLNAQKAQTEEGQSDETQNGAQTEEGQDLEKMSYKDLQEEAKKLGIENKNVKKSDLIKLIEEARK